MEKKQPDYSRPLVFFGILIFLSIVSYHVEKHLGINNVIVFVIWAILTMKVFMWISKKELSYGHPASFFAFAITFSFVGFYIGHTFNIETFIWLVLWSGVTLAMWNWIRNHPQADKRLFHLLGLQSIALAAMIPILLHYANQQTLAAHSPSAEVQHAVLHVEVQPVTAHVAEMEHGSHGSASPQAHAAQDTHATAKTNAHFNPLLLSVLQWLIFLLSILVAISAWRVGREETAPATMN